MKKKNNKKKTKQKTKKDPLETGEYLVIITNVGTEMAYCTATVKMTARRLVKKEGLLEGPALNPFFLITKFNQYRQGSEGKKKKKKKGLRCHSSLLASLITILLFRKASRCLQPSGLRVQKRIPSSTAVRHGNHLTIYTHVNFAAGKVKNRTGRGGGNLLTSAYG